MAFLLKNEDGTISPLAPTAVAAGLGVNAIGKEFEVVGNLVSRTSGDSGGTALALAAEGPGLCSIWTNNAYDPGRPGSGWKRTINLVNGNVGIGGSKDEVALNPAERLVVAGNIVATGDVRLAGADCAEEFDVEETGSVDAGTVMVIADENTIRCCTEPYDTRVAGVLSGAGDCKPGILLGRRVSARRRLPLSLNGKVFCKVDAGYGAVAVGDLLTTSATPGHAMRAGELGRSFGAVLGKALRPLREGVDLIPVLVSLQ